jgi:hypothetical protein
MQTGENIQGLRKIIDFTRLLSIAILVIHFYVVCYTGFREWHFTTPFLDHIIQKTINPLPTGDKGNLFLKSIALLLLIISLVGAEGKKDEKLQWQTPLVYIGLGLLLFFSSPVLLSLSSSIKTIASFYISITSLGFILILTGGTIITRILKLNLNKDTFNTLNESFPQEERLLKNEYSVNLPAQYNLKGKIRKSWINITNPFRGLLVIGSPGSGKSYFVIRHVINQHIQKGYCMLLYDFKYDDLSKSAYNAVLKYHKVYPVKPSFYVINFEDLSRSHRCNPLDPASMTDITDATEASRTIMMGLNREWIKKQGDFFVESPINFVTAVIWFLKKYEDGKYCTLPHVIELMQADYKSLFSLLETEPEVEVLVNPFISAWKNQAFDQLEGQVASAKISMARLASPQLYYVLSGNDFTLDLNNPKSPKVICMGNNPQKQQVYGAVLSLYISRTIKLVNQKNKLKASLIFDEFPTIYFNGMDTLVATARSNKVAATLAVQDYSQLKKDYGRDQAEVILNIVGNIISGQASGETAKHLSERFGKIMQERESVSINSSDTSISKSTQLDEAIPPSKIASLSSGAFVGMVADDPATKIELKVFHNEIINNHDAIKKEEAAYHEIPIVKKVTNEMIASNYFRIKEEIIQIIHSL